MLDLVREIGQTLRNNRLRTVLTGISVSWGIFMLIVLLGASRGVTNYFEYAMSSQSNNVISFWSGVTSMPYKGYKDGRYIGLKSSDIDAILHDNPGKVSNVIAFASVDTAKISTSLDVLTNGFEAVYPGAQATNGIEMSHGRFINERDIADARRVIVLAAKNARLLFGSDSLAVGKTVQSLGLAWTVAGVYDHRWRSQSMVPYTAYKAVTGNTDEAYELDVTVEGLETEADGKAAEKSIRTTLAQRHEFHPDDPNAVWVWNSFTSYLTNKAANRYLELAVWVIGIFTLLTGIVGVSNIMFVSVRERTHEIGIRRAIGAKPRSIMGQVVAESVVITTLFGYIGVVMGMALTEVATKLIEGNATIGQAIQNPTVDLSIAVKVTVVLIISGALAGLAPAIKATKVKPVEALRDE